MVIVIIDALEKHSCILVIGHGLFNYDLIKMMDGAIKIVHFYLSLYLTSLFVLL